MMWLLALGFLAIVAMFYAVTEGIKPIQEGTQLAKDIANGPIGYSIAIAVLALVAASIWRRRGIKPENTEPKKQDPH